MKLHILNIQNALKVRTLISLLYRYYLSSTIFSLCYAYFTAVINTKVAKSFGGVLIRAGGGVGKIFGLEKKREEGRQSGT